MRVLREVCLIATIFSIVAVSSFAQGSRVERELLSKRIQDLPHSNTTLNFLVVGDWGRNGQGDQQDVADWMGIAANQGKAKFVLSTGDNFYCCGVASTDDPQWQTSFEDVFRSHSLQIPWYAILGNHDYEGNVQAQIDYEKKSQRWKMPERYYTKVFRDIRFVFIDTSPLISSYYKRADPYPDLSLQDTTKQLRWIDSVLSASRERWKIVVGHHPVHSVGDHGSEPDMKRLIEQRLEKYKVDVYFAGHDHSLQSLQRKGSNVLHLISGGGSEQTKVVDNPSLVRYAKSVTGFMMVMAEAASLNVCFIDSKGKVIHKEIITKEFHD